MQTTDRQGTQHGTGVSVCHALIAPPGFADLLIADMRAFAQRSSLAPGQHVYRTSPEGVFPRGGCVERSGRGDAPPSHPRRRDPLCGAFLPLGSNGRSDRPLF